MFADNKSEDSGCSEAYECPLRKTRCNNPLSGFQRSSWDKAVSETGDFYPFAPDGVFYLLYIHSTAVVILLTASEQ